MDWHKIVHGAAPQSPHPSFRPGDEVRVWYRILEQGRERLGQFEGLVIRCRGSGPSRTFTVRRVTYGEGVERVFPFDSKTISKIELLRQGKVKRSRLYYLRSVIGKTRIAAADVDGVGKTDPVAAGTAAVEAKSAEERAPGTGTAARRGEPASAANAGS